MSFPQKLDTCLKLLSNRKLEPYLKKIVFSNYKNFSPNTTIEFQYPSTAIGMQPYIQQGDPLFGSLPNKTRWVKIDKNKKRSMYLSFRESLSSFDQFYYYGTHKWNFTQIKDKKEYIRTNSKILSKVIAKNLSNLERYGKKRVFENFVLDTEVVEKISVILGVSYEEIRLIKHNLFNPLGYTCHLKKNDLNYSEAFAGSGEFAVINMVNKIERATDNSLILIDEPEVSLHPEAQRKFLEYLIDKIINNKHQIVIATHSIELIKNLPPSSIKLIKLNGENKAVIERQYCLQDEAFQDLGVHDFNKHKIYVEDDVAELILKTVLAKSTRLTPDLFEIIVFPGGDSRIYSAVVSSACISQSNKGRDEAKAYFIEKTKERYPHLDEVALKNVLISEAIDELTMTSPEMIAIENSLLRFLDLV